MRTLPLFVVLLGCCLIGCNRPPAVSHDHLHLITSLRTACSARNADWLGGVTRAVDQRRTEGKMTEEEHAHFHQLIGQAKAGEWEAAERACLQFEQAQLNRRREAPAEPAHTHSHDHSHGP